MEYTEENLDELYSAKEMANLRRGVTKSEYDKAIQRLENERKAKLAKFDEDIKAIEALIEMVVGDQEKIVTAAGTFTRKESDPRKKSSYVVKVTSTKDTIALFEKSPALAAAIKTETKETKTIQKTPIQEALAAGVLNVSNDGHLVNEDGEILEVEAYLKPVEVKFKANK